MSGHEWQRPTTWSAETSDGQYYAARKGAWWEVVKMRPRGKTLGKFHGLQKAWDAVKADGWGKK